MRGNRLRQTLYMFMTLSPAKRTHYLKEHHIFASLGEHCSIMDRKIPLYANLIKIGNNVHIASKVDFITHDIAHVVLNWKLKNAKQNINIKEKIGCIEIGDNVFIGSNTTILPNVRIGSNVVIGAGSIINKDIMDNSVVAGVPAKVIGSFDDFMNKRLSEKSYPDEYCVVNESVDDKFAEWLWKDFYKSREK